MATSVTPLGEPVAPGDGVEHTTTTRETTLPTPAPSWLHTNLRNVLAVGIAAPVVWMALTGNEQAQAALISAFAVLMGMIWGERSALKRPNIDT